MTNLRFVALKSLGDTGHRSLFLHAWDLAGGGLDFVMQTAGG